MRLIIMLGILFAVPCTAFSATYYVPDHFATIQLAIDGVNDGDTVIVRPGTYVESINYNGKLVNLVSEMGAGSTIIDGAGLRVVTFENDEDFTAVLDGFTLTNGAGGIYVYGNFCNPWIKNNIIKGNSVSWGGGIWAKVGCFPTIENNIIASNSANWGAGIYAGGATSAPIIIGNTIVDNAGSNGGGIAFNGSEPTVMNNLIAGNTATYGAGIFCEYCKGVFYNNTIVDNASTSYGGGLYIHKDSVPDVYNTILWNNTAPTGPEIAIVYTASKTAMLNINYSDVQGGTGPIFVDPNCTLNWGVGMLDADPLFVNPGANDYHLTWLSPCINRGTNLGAPGVDFDGDSRPFMGTVDMGCDEFTGTHPLKADIFTLFEVAGGTVTFGLYGGANNGGRNYILLGSVTGTVPGTPLPGGNAVLPINWDILTNLMIGLMNTPVFQNFMGPLDQNGVAYATFDTLGPIPGTAGLTVSFAFGLASPPAWDFASNPVNIEIQ